MSENEGAYVGADSERLGEEGNTKGVARVAVVMTAK